jgi:hypothetical protein
MIISYKFVNNCVSSTLIKIRSFIEEEKTSSYYQFSCFHPPPLKRAWHISLAVQFGLFSPRNRFQNLVKLQDNNKITSLFRSEGKKIDLSMHAKKKG